MTHNSLSRNVKVMKGASNKKNFKKRKESFKKEQNLPLLTKNAMV